MLNKRVDEVCKNPEVPLGITLGTTHIKTGSQSQFLWRKTPKSLLLKFVPNPGKNSADHQAPDESENHS